MYVQKDTQPTLFWCAYCERVSINEWSEQKFKGGCSYRDCHVNIRGNDFIVELLGNEYRQMLKQGYTVFESTGGDWSGLRVSYHPEYPEVPETGVCYPMPEIKGYVRVLTPEQRAMSEA